MTNNYQLEPVKSSNILKMGHDPSTDSAYVEFRNGGVWRYRNVSRAIYDEWKKSGSVGSYHAMFIKKNPDAHPAEKLS